MGKNPAFQFYPNDWANDPQLKMAPPATRGIWIDFICAMWWAPQRGILSGTLEDLCRLGNCSLGEMDAFLCDAQRLNFADVTKCNNQVTVANRRMVREQKERESTRYRVQRHRNKTSNASVTVPSPSTPSPSTPSPTPNRKRKILLANPDGFAAFWSRYPKKLGKANAEKAWNHLNPQNGLVETILASIAAHLTTDQWSDPQYIPYPATFLNGRRWEDVLMQHPRESTAQRLWREAQEEKHAS